MSCVYCGKDGVQHHSCAQCTYSSGGQACGALICTEDCARAGGWSHGSKCRCDCPSYICQAHALPHAQEAHRKPDGISCFPALARYARHAAEISTNVFLFNAGMSSDDPRPTDATRLSEFLNIVSPGWRALNQLVDRLPSDHYQADPWPDPVGGISFSFTPEFFSEATIDRVFSLSLRCIGAAWAAQPNRDARHLAEMSVDQLRLMPALADWAMGASRRPIDDVLLAWIPEELKLTPRQVDRVFRHMDRAASLDAPMTPGGIADWLVEASLPVFA